MFVIQDRKETDNIIRFDKAWKNACQDDGIGIMEYLSLAPVAQWIEQWIPKPYSAISISCVFLIG